MMPLAKIYCDKKIMFELNVKINSFIFLLENKLLHATRHLPHIFSDD